MKMDKISFQFQGRGSTPGPSWGQAQTSVNRLVCSARSPWSAPFLLANPGSTAELGSDKFVYRDFRLGSCPRPDRPPSVLSRGVGGRYINALNSSRGQTLSTRTMADYFRRLGLYNGPSIYINLSWHICDAA